MKTFAEVIHTCYKNGLNGTRDYRASAGFIVLTPILITFVQLPIVQFSPLPLYQFLIVFSYSLFHFHSVTLDHVSP